MRQSQGLLAIFFQLIISLSLLAQEPTAIEVKQGEIPALNTPSLKEVGDVVYAKFNYTETVGIRLNQAISIKLLSRKISVPEGAFLWRHDAKLNTNFCAGRLTVPGLWKDEEVVCFRDSDRNGHLDSAHILGSAFGKWSELKTPVPFREATEVKAGGGFRYELLYEGVAAGVLRLTYREFVNDMARPSFSQQLTYTLDERNAGIAVFRGARLRVELASNETIKYVVLSGIRD